MDEQLEFKDPHKRQSLAVRTVASGDLEVSKHHRNPRPSHLKALTASIERIGFVTPLVAVERDGSYEIIDGQHRFLAASELGVKRFPVVVVPEKLARKMMSLNVEKDLNIRERCQIALSLYREMLSESPSRSEDHAEVVDIVEQAHDVTLGLAYEGPGRLAGSSFESILKKCDGFLDEPLERAYETRQGRAERLLEANTAVKAVSDKIKEMGAYHSFINQQIMGYANPVKRARKPADFDKTFDKLIAKLEELAENPGAVLGGGA